MVTIATMDPMQATQACAKLRKALEKALRIPEVRTAVDTVIEAFGTKGCCCPDEAVRIARFSLCDSYEVTIDQNLGDGSPNDPRSREFTNFWEKLLTEADDSEKDLVEWLRVGAPVGWRVQIEPNACSLPRLRCDRRCELVAMMAVKG